MQLIFSQSHQLSKLIKFGKNSKLIKFEIKINDKEKSLLLLMNENFLIQNLSIKFAPPSFRNKAKNPCMQSWEKYKIALSHRTWLPTLTVENLNIICNFISKSGM